jgi:hypothetical protein
MTATTPRYQVTTADTRDKTSNENFVAEKFKMLISLSAIFLDVYVLFTELSGESLR